MSERLLAERFQEDRLDEVEVPMRNCKLFCLITVLLVLTLTAWAQKKGAQQGGRQGQGSPQQNQANARKVFEEMISGGRYGEVNQVFDPSCKVHFGNRTLGLQQAVAEGKGWKSAAPDLVMRAEQVSSNGDKVTISWSGQGTHTGRGLGHPPTGKQFSLRNKTVFEFRNGKIVEVWNSEYRPQLYRQLGIPKTTASLFDTAERLWAAVAQILPDPLYASLQ